MIEEIKLSSYEGKKVLVTGHTGFKGGWMCHFLSLLGANVVGFSLPFEKEPSPLLWDFPDSVTSYYGDIGDFSSLLPVMEQEQPEFVFHMAAQPLVLPSYENPVETYQSNVMGTVHICQGVNLCPSVKSFVNVTTDKVYENKEWQWGYREIDPLDGYDPYSNSKSCSELVTASFIRSFFQEKNLPVSTVRAGNVIGGGDRSENRIVPDCVAAGKRKETILIRNPFSVRPYQHVLEPIYAYLMVAMGQYKNHSLAGAYNIGPDLGNCVTTESLVSTFCSAWGEGVNYEVQGISQPHEAHFLRLDCAKLKQVFGWHPLWTIEKAIEETVFWEKQVLSGVSTQKITNLQIEKYLREMESQV